jgi:hypothetical protein
MQAQDRPRDQEVHARAHSLEPGRERSQEPQSQRDPANGRKGWGAN